MTAMRVLVVHNRYQQRGGEDSVVEDEIALLRAAGHAVETVFVTNDVISGVANKIRAARDIADGRAMRDLVPDAVRRFRPDVVHVHNFFPLLSPSVHARARVLGPATVQTLHNFRIACAGGNLLRDAAPCELCVGRSPLPAIVHRCYRGSLVGSAALAHMIAAHRRRGTWQRDVDRFIVLSHFARDIFVRAGVPADRITVKANAVDDAVPAANSVRSGVLFVGRLSEEKGIAVLADAARLTQAEVTAVGNGPLAGALAAKLPGSMRLVGSMARAEARRAMAGAVAVVVPSICYETFSIIVAEAFAAGTPVIASRIGTLAEIVEDGHTGWLVDPGNPADLAAAIDQAVALPQESARRGAAARETYLARYTAQAALANLEAVYSEAIAARRAAAALPGGHEVLPLSHHQTGEIAGL